MSEALQCDKCKMFSVRKYDVLVDRYTSDVEWYGVGVKRMGHNPQDVSDLSVFAHICERCFSDIQKILGLKA